VFSPSSTDSIANLETAATRSSSGMKPLDLELALKCPAEAQDPPKLEEEET
jgi:hypothetical protein